MAARQRLRRYDDARRHCRDRGRHDAAEPARVLVDGRGVPRGPRSRPAREELRREAAGGADRHADPARDRRQRQGFRPAPPRGAVLRRDQRAGSAADRGDPACLPPRGTDSFDGSTQCRRRAPAADPARGARAGRERKGCLAQGRRGAGRRACAAPADDGCGRRQGDRDRTAGPREADERAGRPPWADARGRSAGTRRDGVRDGVPACRERVRELHEPLAGFREAGRCDARPPGRGAGRTRGRVRRTGAGRDVAAGPGARAALAGHARSAGEPAAHGAGARRVLPRQLEAGRSGGSREGQPADPRRAAHARSRRRRSPAGALPDPDRGLRRSLDGHRRRGTGASRRVTVGPRFLRRGRPAAAARPRPPDRTADRQAPRHGAGAGRGRPPVRRAFGDRTARCAAAAHQRGAQRAGRRRGARRAAGQAREPARRCGADRRHRTRGAGRRGVARNRCRRRGRSGGGEGRPDRRCGRGACTRHLGRDAAAAGDRRERARRRAARHLPDRGRRGPGHRRRRLSRARAQQRRSRCAGDGASPVPHAEGQRTHGRPDRAWRTRLGRRARAQPHPRGRPARHARGARADPHRAGELPRLGARAARNRSHHDRPRRAAGRTCHRRSRAARIRPHAGRTCGRIDRCRAATAAADCGRADRGRAAGCIPDAVRGRGGVRAGIRGGPGRADERRVDRGSAIRSVSIRHGRADRRVRARRDVDARPRDHRSPGVRRPGLRRDGSRGHDDRRAPRRIDRHRAAVRRSRGSQAGTARGRGQHVGACRGHAVARSRNPCAGPDAAHRGVAPGRGRRAVRHRRSHGRPGHAVRVALDNPLRRGRSERGGAAARSLVDAVRSRSPVDSRDRSRKPHAVRHSSHRRNRADRRNRPGPRAGAARARAARSAVSESGPAGACPRHRGTRPFRKPREGARGVQFERRARGGRHPRRTRRVAPGGDGQRPYARSAAR